LNTRERDHGSAGRFAAIFTGATVAGLIGQVAWLALGSRALARDAFGTVLAAQAVYSVLQFVVDNGAALHGARVTARGELNEETRSSIARLRFRVAALAVPVALAVGAAGGTRSLIAMAPFALALVLFAALRYWENFGLGDSRPWSTYVVLRSIGPAAGAGAALALGVGFPVAGAGLVECAVVTVVGLAFGFVRPKRARGTLGPLPWREAARISVPIIVWQSGLAAGTVLLNAFGNAGAAAAYAVGLRLVTGINQLAGAVATALFPDLARGGGVDPGADARLIATAQRAIFAVTAGATSVLLARPSLIIGALLDEANDTDRTTALVAVAAAGATGYLVLLTTVVVARRMERIVLWPYVAGTALIFLGGPIVAMTSGRSASVWMAAVFVAGQLVCALALTRASFARLTDVAAPLGRGLAAGSTLLAATLLAATVDALRGAVASGFAGAAVLLAVSVLLPRFRAPVAPSAPPASDKGPSS
jgi:O-antigen/teichoic acid export membrane protein